MDKPLLVELSMVRQTLDRLPVYPIGAGFSLRYYCPGDEFHWTRIQQEAERYHDVTPDLFRREFGDGETQLRERQFFLCDATGREVGTATAWFTDRYRGLSWWGRIHWVAISEHCQGRGLGRALVSAVCQRFIELGHAHAYLTTESVRLPAINLYLGFGFRPEIKNDADRNEWAALRDGGLPLQLPTHGPTTTP